MGQPKLLLPLAGGMTVLARAVTPHLEAGLARVVVVLGCEAAAVEAGAGLPNDSRLRVVSNESWEEGMASSLRCGIQACAAADAVLVALGDEPGVTVSRIEGLLAAWSPGTPLVVPVHRGRPSRPVLFARSLFPQLLLLKGDEGGRQVVRQHWGQAVQVEAEPLLDLDTPADYEALLGDSGILPR
jgi:CTP:molybdopterin cytidylyltransferase MocA